MILQSALSAVSQTNDFLLIYTTNGTPPICTGRPDLISCNSWAYTAEHSSVIIVYKQEIQGCPQDVKSQDRDETETFQNTSPHAVSQFKNTN